MDSKNHVVTALHLYRLIHFNFFKQILNGYSYSYHLIHENIKGSPVHDLTSKQFKVRKGLEDSFSFALIAVESSVISYIPYPNAMHATDPLYQHSKCVMDQMSGINGTQCTLADMDTHHAEGTCLKS